MVEQNKNINGSNQKMKSKDVEPQVEYVCKKHIGCCVANERCLGEYKLFPNGHTSFNARCCTD